MDTIDRRGFLRGVLGCATVAAVATTAGVTLMTSAAEAAPVPADKKLPEALENPLENPVLLPAPLPVSAPLLESLLLPPPRPPLGLLVEPRPPRLRLALLVIARS